MERASGPIFRIVLRLVRVCDVPLRCRLTRDSWKEKLVARMICSICAVWVEEDRVHHVEVGLTQVPWAQELQDGHAPLSGRRWQAVEGCGRLW